MDKKTLWITIASVFGVIVFLAAAYMLTNQAPQVYEQLKTVRANDHVKWSPEKKHILVEYSDFQCPACRNFHNLIAELDRDKEFTKKVSFVYRHFPLDGAHPHARQAAHAAEAASLQGKFYEMHDMLFDKQVEWSGLSDVKSTFVAYAKELKLDVKKFEKDIESQAVKQRVDEDVRSGMEVNVDSTPTFFLDGNRLPQINVAPQFREYIEKAVQ